MDRRTLVAKIKKCLALSKSANEHEAAAALAKARQLMDEAGIIEDDLELLGIEETFTRRPENARPALWEVLLIRAVEASAQCEAVLYGHSWQFIGRGPAPEIAGYAFTVLLRQLRRARAEYLRTQLKRCTLARKRQRADLFCQGWASMVRAKIVALFPPDFDRTAIESYIAQQYPALGTAESRSPAIKGLRDLDDYGRGRVAGRAAELNKGVAGSEAPLAIGAQ